MEEIIELEQAKQDSDFLKAYCKIPYSLITAEVPEQSTELFAELNNICKNYKIYKKGESFNVEGSNGDYVPAKLHYKMSASLINKEARFLFAEPPDVTIEAKGDLGTLTEEAQNALTVYNDLLKTVLDRNNFEDAIVKAAKDCFIGKRVACLVNFNEEDGITLRFLPSTQFIFETKKGNPNIVTKFVCFSFLTNTMSNVDKRIFKKKYELEKVNGEDVVYLQEEIYDGAGNLIEEVTPRQKILLKRIPVSIFINDGLTGDFNGESEIENLKHFEKWYSKLSNADLDAQRKSMNPTKFTVDMEANSTKNLSTGAGAFWDLGSDQNLDNPHPQVGLLEPNMSYSEPLKTTLDRVKTTAYEQIDMPNVTLETMQGAITSGKSLKAIYWPLIVRCKEKMKVWSPGLRSMAETIIEGALVYPNTIKGLTKDNLIPVEYEVSVKQNNPLPEDEIEEKNMDLSEVQYNTMSKKTFMKKWHGLTDEEVEEELQQIALERQIIEDSGMFGDNLFNEDLGKEDKPYDL